MSFELTESKPAVHSGGFSGHESTHMESDEWLTPQHVLMAVGAPGAFDMDPAACLRFPNRAARKGFTVIDNGLDREWVGRVWLNPPYGRQCGHWMKRLAEHGDGIALIFARTETRDFHRYVWSAATAVFFLEGRLTFLRGTGEPAVSAAGAPSCLIAYGGGCAEILSRCKLPGHLVRLRD